MTTLKQKTKFKETEIGFIPEEWEIQDLGSICQFNYGKSLTETKRIKGKIPVYGSSGITGYHNESLTKGPAVIIARKGSIGNVYYEENNFWPIDTTYYISGSTDYHLKFLYYLIQTLNFETYDNSSAVPGLNREDAYNTQIPIPPLSEQKQIAEILSSLDEKIELNRRMNKTLEEIGKGLFKRWFVDFEFPNEDGKPYKSSGGKMVDSELGEIPEGWEVAKIDKLVEICGGGTPDTKNLSFWNGDVHWSSPKDLSNNPSVYLLKTEKKITEEGLKKVSSRLLLKGSLLLSSRAPIGYIALVDIDLAINQGYIAFLPNKYFSNYYMYYWLKINMESIIGAANGSTFLEISKQSFRTLTCLKSRKNILNQFDDLMQPLFFQILNNLRQNEQLISQRDYLLPKLISGRIRVDKH